MKKSILKRKNKSFIKIIISIIFILTLIQNAFSWEITFIVGDVNITRDKKKIKDVDQGAKIIAGDTVSTGKKSTVTLSHSDGSKIELRENTKVMIGNEKIKDSESVSVIAGVVNGKFMKLAKDSSDTKIYTPTTVCSIRGTEFEFAVSDGADSRFELKEGKIDLRNPYGKVSLKDKDNADINLADRPERKNNSESLDQWKQKRGEELDKDPESKADKYKLYMNKLGDNSSKTSGDINSYDNNLKKPSKRKQKDLEKANSELSQMENNVEDELYLNNAAGSSIDGIVGRFQKDKKDIYDNFLKIKEESNKVMEQQIKNYESIKAVREAYKKAYEEIMQKHKENMDQIKGSYDKNKYKPKPE